MVKDTDPNTFTSLGARLAQANPVSESEALRIAENLEKLASDYLSDSDSEHSA